jgi:hypothetical protein
MRRDRALRGDSLHNDALPLYHEQGLAVRAILTDNGREFCGSDSHP